MRRAAAGLALLALLTAACADERLGVDAPDRPGRAVVALDRDSGTTLWRKEVSPPDAATDPVLVDGVVLVPGSELIAYDARSGERLWTLPGFDATVPQVVGGTVVLAADGQVVAVAARSGRSVWRAQIADAAGVFAGTGGVAVLEADQVRLLDLDDGRERWRAAVAGPLAAASTTPAGVAVARLRGGALLLSPLDGREVWQAATEPASSVLLTADRVVVRQAGALSAFDLAGTPVWLLPAGPAGPPLEEVDGLLLESSPAAASSVRRVSDGTVTTELLPDGDVALTRSGLVESGPEVIRTDDWRVDVVSGERPALWLDADDDVVVAVVGWGQPPTRD